MNGKKIEVLYRNLTNLGTLQIEAFYKSHNFKTFTVSTYSLQTCQ